VPRRHPGLEELLREERELVLAFGGFALEIPGAVLVTNERIPVPRFNFVQDVSVARDRLAGFFERALDHYFQRALRPEFHILEPMPGYLAGPLAHFGFEPRPEPRSALLHPRSVPIPAPQHEFSVRVADDDRFDEVVGFWAETREREELRRQLETVRHHANPEETVLPVLAYEGREPAAAALLHGYRGTWGIHGVATQPGSRGRGAASAIVAESVHHLVPEDARAIVIWADQGRVRQRLERLGFQEVARFRVYELAAGAQLHLPPVPVTSTPRWRPPRTTPPSPS
jgi:ribosomal protein S18 acetylase RimI-like enzyme